MTSLAVLAALLGLTACFWVIGAARRLRGLRRELGDAASLTATRIEQGLVWMAHLQEAASGPMRHERQTLAAVLAATDSVGAAAAAFAAHPDDLAAIERLAQAQQQLAATRARLAALTAAYPDLARSESIRRLQDALARNDREVDFARQLFNSAAETYNAAIARAPAVLLARLMRLTPSRPL